MNKKYMYLDNIEDLKKQLRTKTIMQYAIELAEQTGVDKQILHGCITFRVNQYFSDAEKKLVKRGRRKSLFPKK